MNTKRNISESASRKIIWIQFLACILIVALHSTRYKEFTVHPYTELFLDFFFKWLPNMAVPMFSTISGFLLYKDYPPDLPINAMTNKYINKFKSKCKSILLPYLIFNAVWMLFELIVQNIPWISSHMLEIIPAELNIRCIIDGVFKYKYNGVAWYLVALFGFYLLSPIVYTTIHNSKLGVAALVIAFALSTAPYPETFLLRGYIAHFQCFFFMYLGAYLAVNHFEIINQDFSKTQCVFGALLLLILTYLYRYVPYEHENAAIGIVRLVSVYSFWCAFDFLKNYTVPWYVNTSMFVYLTHSNIQKCINKLMAIFLPDGNFSACINTIAGVFLTVIIIMAIAKFLGVFMPPVWKAINGFRVIPVRNMKKEV